MDWQLLKNVSRSFYLSLRLLPEPVRDSIALAYLLARLTDTEADGVASPAEAELLERRQELIGLLESSPDRVAIEEVWATIQSGQKFDQERFSQPTASPLSPEELDSYTYLVAGCVGEFWTKLCAAKIPEYSSVPLTEMLELGVRFGKGLQLVNILRDRAVDAELGRVYVPQERFQDEIANASVHLDAAAAYTRQINVKRLRMACFLPYTLGRETLKLVAENPNQCVKVSRGKVWGFLLKSLFE